MAENSKTVSWILIAVGLIFIGLGAVIGHRSGVYLVEAWWTIILLVGGVIFGAGAQAVVSRK